MVDASDRIRKRVQQAFAGIAANEYYGPALNPPVYTPLTPGELSVVAQSPFACTNPCSDSTQSGSLYFTNSPQSYLLVTNTSDFLINTSAFTIEWWQYLQTPPTSGATGSTVITPTVFAFSQTSAAPQLAAQWSLTGPSFTTYSLRLTVAGSAVTYNSIGSLPNILDRWVHVALVGSGNTNITVYFNGVSAGTGASTYTITNNTTTYPFLAIGNTNPASGLNQFPGFITNFRYVVGAQVYTAAFTPPKAPLDPFGTGTRLLLDAPANAPFSDTSNRPAPALPQTVTDGPTVVTWDNASPFYNTQN